MRRKEGLRDSKHAPKKLEDEKEKAEDKEKADAEADGKEKGKEEEYRAIDPKQG